MAKRTRRYEQRTMGAIMNEGKLYRLLRLDDGLIKSGYMIHSVCFKENGTFKDATEDKVLLDHSIVIRNHNGDWWQTTEVKEILEETEDDVERSIKFTTKNSTYILKQIK